jgi:rRNA processing protein Krr1/Pno1
LDRVPFYDLLADSEVIEAVTRGFGLHRAFIILYRALALGFTALSTLKRWCWWI